MARVLFLGLFVFCFSMGNAFALYECPNPKEEHKKTERCKYVREGQAQFKKWNKKKAWLYNDFEPKRVMTLVKYFSLMGQIAADCIYTEKSVPPYSDKNCAIKERDATNCLAPSKVILPLLLQFTELERGCTGLPNNAATRSCILAARAPFEQQHYRTIQQAGDRLWRITKRRNKQLASEELTICSNQCVRSISQAPAGPDIKNQCVYKGRDCKQCSPGTTPQNFVLQFPNLYPDSDLKGGEYLLTQMPYWAGSSSEQEANKCTFVFNNGSNAMLILKLVGTKSLPNLQSFAMGKTATWAGNGGGMIDCSQPLTLIEHKDSTTKGIPNISIQMK